MKLITMNASNWTHLMESVGDMELERLQLNGLGRFSGPWKRHWIFFPRHGLLIATKRDA